MNNLEIMARMLQYIYYESNYKREVNYESKAKANSFYVLSGSIKQFNSSNWIVPYNTQDRAIDGYITPTLGSMYYVVFTVDTALLQSDYAIHFDLYNTALARRATTDIDITQFAPFSHDAQSRRVPEPHTILLLGIGLLGLWIGRKGLRFSKGVDQTMRFTLQHHLNALHIYCF